MQKKFAELGKKLNTTQQVQDYLATKDNDTRAYWLN